MIQFQFSFQTEQGAISNLGILKRYADLYVQNHGNAATCFSLLFKFYRDLSG